MTSDLGRLLSEARAARNLSYADVEAATHIRRKFLESLESGNYDALPGGAIGRGFLRNYALYLGVDVDEAMHLYVQESGPSPESRPLRDPVKVRPRDYRPLEEDLGAFGGRGVWRLAIAAVLLVALGSGGWWVLKNNALWDAALMALGPLSTPTPATTPSPAAPAAQTQWTPTITLPPPPPTDALPTATPTSDLLPLPIPTTQPTVTPTPRPTATFTPEPVVELTLGVKTTASAWILVIVDGKTAQEGVLEANQSRTWEAKKSITIRSGNAGGAALNLNGKDLGVMGGSGQVVERSWVVVDGQIVDAVNGKDNVLATMTPKP